MLTMVKLKFENSNKIFEFCFNDNDSTSLVDQQKNFLENLDYETYEIRKMHHLFNPETQMFILNTSELKSRKIFNFNLSQSKYYFHYEKLLGRGTDYSLKFR